MDQTILDCLNASVKANEHPLFLGISASGARRRLWSTASRIRCKKIFAVPGNHDKQIRKLTEEFSWLGNLAEIPYMGNPS